MIGQKPLIFWVTLSLALHVVILAWCPVPGFFTPPYPVYLAVDLFSGPAISGTGHGLDAESGGGGKPAPAATAPPKKVLQPLPKSPKPLAKCERPDPQNPPTTKSAATEKTSKYDPAPEEPEDNNTSPEHPPETDITPKSAASPVLAVTAKPLTGRKDNGGEGPVIVSGSGTGDGTGSGTGPGNGPGSGPGQGSRSGSGSPVETPMAYGSNPPPPYPNTARRRGWEGEVMLLVEVSAAGEVCKITVSRSSGYRILDRAAINAVYRWRFQAALRNGRAVAGKVIVPIRFDIKDAK